MFRTLLRSLFPVMLSAAVGAGVAIAVVDAQEPAAPPAAETALGYGFTYQGRLDQSSLDATGPFDFQFILYDGEGITAAQVGTAVPVDDLQVTNGLFSVSLNFGSTAFLGANRWLEVRVRPGATPGNGGFQILGRQQITATPYALYSKSTAFGQTLAGSGEFGLEVNNSASQATGIKTAGNQFGLDASTTGDSQSAGVRGTATLGIGVEGTSESQFGVAGSTKSAFGSGVFGTRHVGAAPCGSPLLCAGVTGFAPVDGNGVEGISVAGPGVLALGQTGVRTRGIENAIVAVAGRTANDTNSNQVGNGLRSIGSGKGQAGAAVFGYNESNLNVNGGECLVAGTPANDYCVGLYGSASGAASLGVYGEGQKFGVWGTVSAPAIQSNGAGIVGVKGAGEWAGRFIGPVLVEAGMSVFGNISATGTVTCANCNPVVSDSRTKRGVTDLSDGLAEVMRLRPVTFEWDPAFVATDTAVHTGLIAQEVREVLPANVYETADGLLGVNYPELTPVLIRAIQEQQREIEALQKGHGAGSGVGPSADSRLAWLAMATSVASIALCGAMALAVRRRG